MGLFRKFDKIGIPLKKIGIGEVSTDSARNVAVMPGADERAAGTAYPHPKLPTCVP